MSLWSLRRISRLYNHGSKTEYVTFLRAIPNGYYAVRGMLRDVVCIPSCEELI